ncbi:hypothetical protein ARMGADRAFT_1134803, partial [Armillaria gallica]
MDRVIVAAYGPGTSIVYKETVGASIGIHSIVSSTSTSCAMSSRKKHSNRKQQTRPSHPTDVSSEPQTSTGKAMRVVGVLVDDTSSVFMNTTTNAPLKDIIQQTEERLAMTLQNSFHFDKPPKINFCQIGPGHSREKDIGNNLLRHVPNVDLLVPTAYAAFIPDVDEGIANKLKKDRADATMYRLQESTQTAGASMQQMQQQTQMLPHELKTAEVQISASRQETEMVREEGRRELQREVAAAIAHDDRRVAAVKVELQEVQDTLADHILRKQGKKYDKNICSLESPPLTTLIGAQYLSSMTNILMAMVMFVILKLALYHTEISNDVANLRVAATLDLT